MDAFEHGLTAVAESPYNALHTDEAEMVLAKLEEFDETRIAAAVALARAHAAPAVAAAAVAAAFARRRARATGKFDHPERMLFTHVGYEQATSSAVARHRSARLNGLGAVADLCCGIGSDALALAQVSTSVRAVDVDADALACAAHNAREAGVGDKISFTLVDALSYPLDGVDAAFADPSRRERGARLHLRGADAYVPPLNALLRRAKELPDRRLGIKAAPGLDYSAQSVRDSLDGAPLEIEAISERGSCKEVTLWCGALARADGARRATVIDSGGAHILDADPHLEPVVKELDEFIGEPDPAVVRAGLIPTACALRSAGVLDRRVAYVTTGVELATDPFIRWYRVRDAMGFHRKRLRAYLRARAIGVLVVKTRAFPLRPDEIEALLEPRGDARVSLICSTIQGRKVAIVCEPVARSRQTL